MTSNQTIDDARTAARQFAALTERISESDLAQQTPCSEWNVGQLLDHVHVATINFIKMAQGQEPVWDLQAPDAADRASALRSDVDALVSAWDAGVKSEAAAMAVPEYALHAWDLATSLGMGTGDLDQPIAQRAHDFMSEQLTDDRRAPSFGPEQEPPADGNDYDRLAAFSGRSAKQ